MRWSISRWPARECSKECWHVDLLPCFNRRAQTRGWSGIACRGHLPHLVILLTWWCLASEPIEQMSWPRVLYCNFLSGTVASFCGNLPLSFVLVIFARKSFQVPSALHVGNEIGTHWHKSAHMKKRKNITFFHYCFFQPFAIFFANLAPEEVEHALHLAKLPR